jgi:hypothetical protein
MFTSFAYCVVLGHPQSNGRVCNADAVGAALVNCVYQSKGARQTTLQGLDLRNAAHKAHVTKHLATRNLKLPDGASPLFYSSRDNVFTRPGMVSLQLLLDVVSMLVPVPPPNVVSIILQFAERHDLNFTEAWASELERVESPEYKM